MAKSDYAIELITKEQCSGILMKYHYLKDISRGFKSGFNCGLILNGKVVGVCIFTGFPTPELAVGMYGLCRSDQAGLYELSRLCIDPSVQASEYNITSWFVSRSIKKLKRSFNVRSILSYADSDRHSGTIYKACNFKYYGVSAQKKDFWILNEDGTYKKHSRGKVKGVKGEWRPRSVKHRFAMTIDNQLKIKWDIINNGER